MTYKERIATAVPNPDANEKTIFSDAADGLLKTKDSSGVVETLATTEGLAATEPKVYIALLTQNGTNAPVATVLKNTLGGVPVWTRNSVGDYSATLTDAFTVGKTVLGINSNFNASAWDSASSFKIATLSLTGLDNTVLLNTVTIANGVSIALEDDSLNDTLIKIEVYP